MSPGNAEWAAEKNCHDILAGRIRRSAVQQMKDKKELRWSIVGLVLIAMAIEFGVFYYRPLLSFIVALVC